MPCFRRPAFALWLALAYAPALHAAAAPAAAGAHAARRTAPNLHHHKVAARDPQVDRWIDVAGFGEVALYRPKTPARGLALFASGDGGWNLGVTDMAHQAAALGYWVAGFDTPKFLKGLDAADGACSDARGLLARLGSGLVQTLHLAPDTRPVIIGYSSGATIAYAALAADAGQRFGGGISLGFCPDLLMHKPFCAGPGGLTQRKQTQPPFGHVFDKRDTVLVRWRILQGEADQICDPKFAAEFAAGQKDAKALMLPRVGHGFGVPKNWMPQYLDSVRELLAAPH